MKFFIFFLCTTHLLTEISAWLMTTPMQSALRSKTKNDATRKVMKLVEMIQFINNAYHNGHSGGFHSKHVSRRFELPVLENRNRPAILEPKQDDKESQLDRIPETVRYHVINNPEVLEEYSNKRKEKMNEERYLMGKKKSSIVIDNQSPEVKYIDIDGKLKSYHKNAVLKGGSLNSTNILNTPDTFVKTNPSFELDGDPELTNIEPTYQPTFADSDEDDNIKLIRIAEKKNDNPRTDEKNHALIAKIYNTNKSEKRMSIKVRDMTHKVSVHEDNAHKDDLIDTGLNKLEPQPLQINNDQVTKTEENKEFDYKNNNYSVNNEAKKQRKDKKLLQRSGNKYKRKHTTPVHVASRKHKKKTKQEREEGHLIYASQERNESRYNYHKKRYEKMNDDDEDDDDDDDNIEVKKDMKRNGKENRDKETDLNNSDFQKYHDGMDKMEYEWNKRHLQYDRNDNMNNDNQRDSDDERTKKHHIKKDHNWNKRDKKLNKRESSLNRKLNMREIMDSEIEKEDTWYLKNEGLLPILVKETLKDGRVL